jgi:hypothetical protein
MFPVNGSVFFGKIYDMVTGCSHFKPARNSIVSSPKTNFHKKSRVKKNPDILAATFCNKSAIFKSRLCAETYPGMKSLGLMLKRDFLHGMHKKYCGL